MHTALLPMALLCAGTAAHAAGSLPLAPSELSSTEKARSAPPSLGQHTEEVLTSIGYDDEHVRSLKEHGTV